MSSQLGNLAISSGVNTSFNAPNEGVKAIIIGNESGLTVTITMEGGGVSKTLYPSTLDWFSVYPGFTGNILIKPITILGNVGTFPSSTLVFDAIGVNDSESPAMYPVTLNRAVNSLNSIAQNLVSTGLPAATTIVFGNPVGDSGIVGCTNIENSGFIGLGDGFTSGQLQIGGPTLSTAALAPGVLTLVGLDGATGLQLSGAVPTVVHGSGGGTVTFKTPFWGNNCKLLEVIFAGYIGTGDSFTLPSTISRGMWFSSYNGTSTCAFGSVDVATGLGSGTARGTDIGETTIFANSFGSIQVTSSTTFTVNTTGGVAVNGMVLVIG